MSSKLSMMKTMVVTAALVAGVSGFAQAADNSTRSARDQAFAIQNKILQDESTSMPSGSPPVDTSAPAADPVPKATGLSEEEARFRVMDEQLQKASTGMPVGSPPVDRTSVNQDPRPSPAAEEKFLEQNSTK